MADPNLASGPKAGKRKIPRRRGVYASGPNAGTGYVPAPPSAAKTKAQPRRTLAAPTPPRRRTT